MSIHSAIEQIIHTIDNLTNFPAATICRHAVIVDLLQILEDIGVSIPDELFGAAVDADDETISVLMSEIKEMM